MKPTGTANSAAARGVGLWWRLLSRLGVDVRPGEGAAVMLLFLGYFLFITFQYTTKSVRQSTFLGSLGAARLPYVYLLVALCSYPLLRLYGRMVDRLPRHQLIAATCSAVSLSLALFWWLYLFPWKWVPVVFYIWVSIVFLMIISQFWSFSTHVLDPRQAKRLFGFIAAGGLLGGIAGGQVARLATEVVGTRYALLVAAGVLVTAAGVMLLVHRLHPPEEEERSAGGAAGLGKLDRARGGLEVIRGSRHLQLTGLVLVLAVMVAQVVDLQFNWAVEQTTAGLDQRTAFFGNFYSIMGISAFLFQILFAARIHRFLGVGFAMRVLPVTMAIGTGSLILAAAVIPGAMIGAALVLKIGENGLRYSLDQSTRELLFLPVPTADRLKAKAYIDVFIARGAKGLAALLLLPVTFGIFTGVQAGWVSLALIVVWLAATVALKREYVTSFRRGLESRTVDATIPINLSDVTTLEILVHSLGSSDSRQVLHSLSLLASHGRGNLVPPLLLYHDDPLVRLKMLQVLAEVERRDALHLIERRLSDEDAEVRAEAVRTLAVLHRADACSLMEPRLGEAEPGVRAAAIACLANYGEAAMVERAQGALEDLLSDAEPKARAEAAKAIGAVREPTFADQLIELHYDADARVVREAVAAVSRRVARDGINPRYVPMLVSLLDNRRLKHEAREALVAFGEPVIPALVHYMHDPNEQIWVRRAIPKTIARIATPAAARALAECLGKPRDAFLRRKIIEALGSLTLDPETGGHRPGTEEEVAAEARRYLRHLADLLALCTDCEPRFAGPRVIWDDPLYEPSLLEQLLAVRINGHLLNLFDLVALLYPARAIRAAYRSLISERAALRGTALEYLDNTLEGNVKRVVFAVIDDCPLAERLSRAEQLFGIAPRKRAEAIGGALRAETESDPDACPLLVAALYAVYTDKISSLYGEVARLRREAGDPRARETAQWVAGRLQLSGA